MSGANHPSWRWLDGFLLLALTGFLASYFDLRYLLTDTVVTGGDTASWYGVADHLSRHLLPAGRLTGWDMGNFCGYPNFSFYFLPPFLVAVIPHKLLGLPLTICLKWAIMSGVYLLPLCVYLGLRRMDYRFPLPIFGSAASLLLLFNESYTMFGGNALSTFAGEFCYMQAFALLPLFYGSFYRGLRRGSGAVGSGLLLGLIGLTHLFVFIPALFGLIWAAVRTGRLRYVLHVGLNGFALMAFWILPLIAQRQPYTTAVDMIWHQFVNWRYVMAAMFGAGLIVTSRILLDVARQPAAEPKRVWGFGLGCGLVLMSGVYLAGSYLVLGRDIWLTGLSLSDFSQAPLEAALAQRLQPWLLPIAIVLGAAGAWTVSGRCRQWPRRLHRVLLPRMTNERFNLWLFMICGALCAYFCAHFLRVPDIRFLPPVALGLLMILFVEIPAQFKRPRDRWVLPLGAISAVYLVILTVMFSAQQAHGWFRYNNRGYQAAGAHAQFNALIHYLGRSDDPLNAPRVAYEKSDRYGAFGGDRVFESLPVFSGRQTLEGIHYASALGARQIAFLQTTFSKEVKTPAPLILSRIDAQTLSSHCQLYNISQLVVISAEAKHALGTHPDFRREADFGPLTVFRHLAGTQSYVSVPQLQPLRFTGRNWTESFYHWFKQGRNLDVLLVADAYIRSAADRDALGPALAVLPEDRRLQSQPLVSDGASIDCRLENDRIVFTTNQIGRPHLIRVSYFPNWRVRRGADGVYPASPHFMLVIPKAATVELVFGRSLWEILGALWAVVWFGGISVYALWRRRLSRKASRGGLPKASIISRAVDAIEGRLLDHRRSATIALLGLAIAMGTIGAIYRDLPTRRFVSGYRHYLLANRLQTTDRLDQAQTAYQHAIETLAPLVEAYPASDHRDRVNAILLTAACHEKRRQIDSALASYRQVIIRYPYSRYVAECHVKSARLCIRTGVGTLRQGVRSAESKTAADPRLAQALAWIDRGIHHYHQALEKDPYSVWAKRGRNEIRSTAFDTIIAAPLQDATRNPDQLALLKTLRDRWLDLTAKASAFTLQ